MVIQVVPMGATVDRFLDFNSVSQMGWQNIAWVVGVLTVLMLVKFGKMGGRIFRPMEFGLRECMGFILWPVGPGVHPFISGLWDTSKTSGTAVRVVMSRRVIRPGGDVYLYVITVFVTVVKKRKLLKAAIYSTIDEDKKDLENNERISQIRTDLEGVVRLVLEADKDPNCITKELLVARYGDNLAEEYGSVIHKVSVQELSPTEAQLIKKALEAKGHVGEITDEDIAGAAAHTLELVGSH